MEEKAITGQVLPFARSAEYLRRLAVKQREMGKLLPALELLRLSLAKAPEDAQTVMEIAETYAQMQCPTLSNRALFSLLDNDEMAPECFYGAGCNFYAIQMFDCARDCLVLYLQKRPDGAFAPEAVDMIEAIDTTNPETSALEMRINRRIERVLDSMDADKPYLAVRQIRRALALEQRNGGTHALLSFALLAAGDEKGALEAARYAMRLTHDDIRAVCAMAAALMANLSGDAARIFLERAVKRAENDDDLQLVCQTACEMGQHATVYKVLARMEAEAPLSDELLHLLASASINVGEKDNALRCWRLLRRIAPMDSVAEYRLKLAEEGKLATPVSYNRQVPLEETLNRLSRLRAWVQEGAPGLGERWAEDDELEKLLRWGGSCTEAGVPQAMIGVLTTMEDARGRAVLKDMLCDVFTPDTLKHSALAALCVMGMKGPYYALVRGRLTLVHVSKVNPKETDVHLKALMATVKRRLGPITQEEETCVGLLCGLSVSHAVANAAVRARVVELAFRRMRGESVSFEERPGKRRKMERYARRLMKEAQNGMH